MILSLAIINLVVGLFLGQAPVFTNAHQLSTRQDPVNYQAMKGSPLGRRNFHNLPSSSYQGDGYEKHGSYETSGQYDQSGTYSSSGNKYDAQEDGYNSGKDTYVSNSGKDNYSSDSGKDEYSSGNGNSDYDLSKIKSYNSYKNERNSYGSTPDKDPYQSTDSDKKESTKYEQTKGDKASKDPVDSKNGGGQDDEVPSHLDHQPISVPKYGSGGGSSSPSDGKKVKEGSGYSNDKGKTDAHDTTQTDKGAYGNDKDAYNDGKKGGDYGKVNYA